MSCLKKLTMILAGGLVLILTTASARAVTISLDAAADTYFLYADGASTPHGGESTLVVKTDSGGKTNTRKAYVRFDLGGIDPTKITDATLKMTVATQASTFVRVYGYKDGQADYSTGSNDGGVKSIIGDRAWTDAGPDELVRNTAPATWFNSGTYFGAHFYSPFVDGGTSLDSESGNVAAGTVIDYTGQVLNFLQADTNGQVTFMFSSTNNAFFRFASSEHGTTAWHPQLVLEVATIPEPTSVVLAMLGLVGLGVVRRRRRR